jgi:8-oxo-dGTP diphosphatase
VTDRVVVGAAIVRAGRVLAGRRRGPAELAGRWEFPGGSVEVGESDAVALARECREELAVEVAVGPLVGSSVIRPGLLLRVYRAELVAGEPAGGPDHDELRWLGPAELGTVPWLPADRPIVAALAETL